MRIVEEVMREAPLLVCTDHLTKARKILRDDIYRELYIHDGSRKLMGYIDITDALRVTDTRSNVTVEGFLREAPHVTPKETIESAAMAIRRAGTDSVAIADEQRRVMGVVLLSDIFPLLISSREIDGRVGSFMTAKVVSIGAEEPVPQVYNLIVESGYTAFPVLKGGNIIGIVSRRDILRRRRVYKSLKNLAKTPVESIMSTPAICVSPDEDLNHAAAMLVKHDISRMPVVQDGKIVGIVDRHDLLKALKVQD